MNNEKKKWPIPNEVLLLPPWGILKATDQRRIDSTVRGVELNDALIHVLTTRSFPPPLPTMIKSYQGDGALAVNPLTGKREIVDPEGEFIPGETIVKAVLLQAARRVCDGSRIVTLPSRNGWLHL